MSGCHSKRKKGRARSQAHSHHNFSVKSSVLPLALALYCLSAPRAMAQSVVANGDTTPMPPDGVVAGDLLVGEAGTGSLSISGGGSVSNENAILGRDPGSDGTATVSGADAGGTPSRWDSSGYLEIGAEGTGTLTIEHGGVVTSAEGYIAGIVNSVGTVTVTGDGSSWSNASLLSVGQSGTGSLTIADGGFVSNGDAVVGSEGTGDVLVTGEGSRWVSSGRLTIGSFSPATGTLRIEAGAAVTSGLSIVGSGGTGDVIVTGGASWTNTDQLVVGNYGAGTLTIDGGSTVTSTQVYIGASSTGVVTVSGVGSSWISDDEIVIGNYGTGTLTVSDGGRVRADYRIYLGASSGGGTLTVSGQGVLETAQIGAGDGNVDVTIDGGIVRATRSNTDFINGFGAQAVTIGAGDAIFDTAGFDIRITAELAGAGGLQKAGAGTLTLTAANSYAGGTVIEAGTLQLGNGGASGSVVGDVVNDGMLAFNRADSLMFTGTISGGGGIHQMGAGTTVLTAANTYTGGTTIAAGTLQLGNGGTSGSLVGGVVNDGLLAFNRSDSMAFAGAITGSGGVDQVGSGATVLTADNSYIGGTRISAGTLQLGDGGTSGRIVGNVVNDGTLAFNRSDSVTFAGAISGGGGVHLVGSGTTVLTGANSYAGGTTISSGTLQIASDTNLGAGTGGITLDAGTLATTADLTSSRAVVLADAGILFAASGTTFALNGQVSGPGALTKDGSGTLLLAGNSAGYTGDARVAAGTLMVDGVLGGALDIQAAGRLEGNGQVGGVVHTGTIAPGHGGIGTLTIAGDYAGNGGALLIETALAGDGSPTDRLSVTGSTSGSAQVVVINRDGLGGLTSNGIKIIDVAGSSNASFALRGDYVFQGHQTVVAGAYGYRLLKNGIADPDDGDWYLRSNLSEPSTGGDGGAPPSGPLLQPGVPVYEIYPQTLLALNGLPTLQQRVGNRRWMTAPTQTGNGIWGRIEGERYRPEADDSTSGADHDSDLWRLQMGADVTLAERPGGGVLIGGLTAHYGKADAGIGSVFGDGGIDTQGYGLGATLTWYGPRGLYLDGQAQFSWFDSDLKSSLLGDLTDSDGTGMAFSVEAGKRVAVGGAFSVTPQAQVVYSEVDFDRFLDPVGAIVSMSDGDSLESRLGLSLDWQKTTDAASGDVRRTHLYGIAGLTYEWLDGTRVDVSGTPIAHRNDRLRGELGLGGSYSGSGDKLTLYTEITANTSIENFGEGYSLRGTAGFRIRF